MTLEQFYLYQEQTFDSFCKTLIRNESADAHNELAAQASREITMSALSYDEMASLHTEDVYQPYRKTFFVYGNIVTVFDCDLGQALQFLPPQRRDVILLFYFMGLSEPQIGRLMHLSTSTVNYRRSTALRRLKELMEGFEYGC